MPTGYQYAKLGSNLEYLRGICSASLAQTTSLAAFPGLLENVPARRYLVVNVVKVLRSLLAQFEELQLPLSGKAAAPFGPMLKEMEDYLSTSKTPGATLLNDLFAERLIAVARQVILAGAAISAARPRERTEALPRRRPIAHWPSSPRRNCGHGSATRLSSPETGRAVAQQHRRNASSLTARTTTPTIRKATARRYQKDENGKHVNVTTYQWNAGDELIAVVSHGARTDYTGNVQEQAALRTHVDLFMAPADASQPRPTGTDQSPSGGFRIRYYAGGKYHPSEDYDRHAERDECVGDPPCISVVIPVFNGASLLDRAVRSVVDQTFPDWELLAVDDGSHDGSHDLLRAWAERDKRIRVIRLAENSGPSVARNAALREARGQLATYLDHDDEYYPDYLAQVARLQDRGEVLVFNLDVIDDDRDPLVPVRTWEPARTSGELFARNIVVPLGAAHRRALWEKAGGLNELLPTGEDDDFLRRVARTGVAFAYVPFKGGRYHVLRRQQIAVPAADLAAVGESGGELSGGQASFRGPAARHEPAEGREDRLCLAALRRRFHQRRSHGHDRRAGAFGAIGL